MSGVKTLLAGLCVMAGGAQAVEDWSGVFAECVGRYSAQMEHAWLMGDPSADMLKSKRLTFLSLLDATMPVGGETAALARRIDTKMAHASLLTVATFGSDPVQADAAAQMVLRHINTCAALLLDS